MKNLCRVEILGREYTVKSDDGEERVKKIAAFVNQKIKEVTEKTQTVTSVNVAILAALNIADEYFRSIEKQSRIQNIDARSGRLIELIDAQLR